MRAKTGIFFFLLAALASGAFAVGEAAYVVKIAPYPDRPNALQVFLDKDNDSRWEKRLDLFGEGVQQILKDNIKENGGVIYEAEGLKSDFFTSNRVLAIILPDGKKVGVLDLFPHFNDTTLQFSFPYAFAQREREKGETP